MQLLRRSTQVLRAIAETPGGMTLQELVNQLGHPARHHAPPAVRAERRPARGPPPIRPPIRHRADDPPLRRGMERSREHRRGHETAPAATAAGRCGDGVRLTAARRQGRLCRTGREHPRAAAVRERRPGDAAPCGRCGDGRSSRIDDRRSLARPCPTAASRRTPARPRPTSTSSCATMPHIRSQGYDVCENEIDHDVWAVAAPIGSEPEQVEASVTVAAPRPLPERRDPLRDHLAGPGRGQSHQLRPRHSTVTARGRRR